MLTRRPAESVLLVMAVLTVLFSVPALDTGVSRLFYASGFSWNPHGTLEFVRAAAPTMIVGSLLFFVLVWIMSLGSGDRIWGMSTRAIAFLVASAAVGPGLLVETLLKPNWGRARPKDLTMFGGESAYTSPFVIAHECARNCSFVSGHAAIAFWLTAYAFLLPPPWRARGLWIGAGVGLAVGFVRVAQGAHFPSDVAAAGLMVIAVNIGLARLVLDRA
ncbi:MAG: phosphatase PAP2 family protein [Rhodospirillaceae bacterium]